MNRDEPAGIFCPCGCHCTEQNGARSTSLKLIAAAGSAAFHDRHRSPQQSGSSAAATGRPRPTVERPALFRECRIGSVNRRGHNCYLCSQDSTCLGSRSNEAVPDSRNRTRIVVRVGQQIRSGMEVFSDEPRKSSPQALWLDTPNGADCLHPPHWPVRSAEFLAARLQNQCWLMHGQPGCPCSGEHLSACMSAGKDDGVHLALQNRFERLKAVS